MKRNQNTKYVNQNTKGANQNIITKKMCYFFFLILIFCVLLVGKFAHFCVLFRTNIRYGSYDVQSVCGRVQLPNSLLILWLLLPELLLLTAKEAARPSVECDSLTHMMAHIYPYTWEPLSEEDDATVKQCYGHLGHCRELVRCQETISFTTAHVLNTIFLDPNPS